MSEGAYRGIRNEYISVYGTEDLAAIAFARDLMRSEPIMLKAGYSRENAIIAAEEVFPGAIDHVDWRKEIPDAE